MNELAKPPSELGLEGSASPTCPERSHYHPLPATGRYIRVMRLCPGQGDEPVVCKLHHTDLNDPRIAPPSGKERYYALSYVWGDASDTCELSVRCSEGQYFIYPITRNLDAGLRQLRTAEHHIWLWVDQICIDQSSLTERQSQVALMKSIYEKASKVIAWLGPAADDSDIAMEKLEETGVAMHNLLERCKDWSSRRTTLMSKGPGILGQAGPELTRAWRAVQALFNRRWWRRTWVLQEASALSTQDTSIICGTKRLSLETLDWCSSLINAMTYFTFTEELSFLRELSTSGIRQITRFRHFRNSDLTQTIFQLAGEHSDFQASDPRDKIYSMLNFASDVREQGFEIRADYSRPAEAMFADLVIYHIVHYKNLGFVGYCARSGSDATGRPRWIPDWSTRIDSLESSASADGKTPGTLYNASGKFAADITMKNPPISMPTHLKVCGVRVVTVADLIRDIDRRTVRAGIERPWLRPHASSRCSLTGMTLNDVFQKTVVADAYFKDAVNASDKRLSRGAQCFGNEQSSRLHPGKYELYYVAVSCAMSGRRLFRTHTAYDQGLLGLGPKLTNPDDEVWMLKGGSVLYMLRPAYKTKDGLRSTLDLTGGPSGDQYYSRGSRVYKFIGECFMVGLMDGEILEMMGEEPKRPRPAPLKDMDIEFRTITLI